MRGIARVMAAVLALQSASCAVLLHGNTDEITINSSDPRARIDVDGQPIGYGSATMTAVRGTTYTISATDTGCTPATVKTGWRFDKASLWGLPLDYGILSILVFDMAETKAAYATDPLVYQVDPVCPHAPATQVSGGPSSVQQ